MSAWCFRSVTQPRALALLCVLLLTPQYLEAADSAGQLEIQATLGFADTFRLGYWAPLTVAVTNHGNHVLGEIQVRLTYGDMLKDEVFTKTHRRSLDISRDSRKRIRFTVFVEAFAVPLEIRVVSGGTELARHSIDLRRKFTEARVLLVLGRDANLDYLNDSGGHSLRVLYPHPELLPDHWQGYDGVSAIIVHGVSLENLSRRQFAALQKWLAQGGSLAVSGGPDYALLRSPRLAALLPATPSGLLTSNDSAAVGRALGEPLVANAPFFIHRLAAIRGEVLFQTDDLPLVVSRATGVGQVLYLGFDVTGPPFDRWTGMHNLWSTLLRIPPPDQSFERRLPRGDSLVPAVLDRPTGGFIGHGIMLVFLMLYLGLLATVYHLQPTARMGTRKLSAVILACPLLFAPAAYFLFVSLLFPTGASAVIASVIEPFPSGPYARLSVDLGLFAKQKRRLRLEFAAAEPVFMASRREKRFAKTASYNVNEGAGRTLEIAGTRAYVLHLLQAQDIIAYDVKVSAVRTDSGIQLSVRNNTGQSWPAAWLISRRNIHELGALTDNQGETLSLRADTAHFELEGASWSAIPDLTGPENFEPHMLRTVLTSVLDNPARELGPREGLLAALVPSPVKIGETDASWQHEVLSVVLVRFEIADEMPGDAR